MTIKSAELSETIEPQRWDQLKSILKEALEQPSLASRTALLETRCADDAVLLREAESLLAEADSLRAEPTDWLETCAEQATKIFWDEDLSRDGQRIGAYVVLHQLGRGGMGAVYLAARADGQFEKEVAIKVLKRGTDTDEVLQRFRTERQILAQLDHPNIARLLDAGTTEDGLPYFVMEHVVGMPVTQFVRTRQLPVTERLHLFLKICAAVEVAHRSQVIHRDLKPGNILVNAEGEPKLLDFGIAKFGAMAGDTDEATATREQRLTPICASPEQARGERVTAASDIYALGALLYEMLSDQKPHHFSSTSPSSEELVRVLSEEEPMRPSLLAPDAEAQRQLRGALDNIVLVALRQEPARRYASVSDFAADVRRYLDGQEVTARPEAALIRVRRFARRNQPRLLATAAALLVLVAVAAFLLSRPNISVAPQETAPIAKSIAVLPFQNLSTTPEDAFFAAGVQDAILTDLAKIADLKVINRTSVQQYASDVPRDLRAISQQLRVVYVLEGSVQRVGERVRVTAKLSDARTNAQTWAERYEQDLGDVFALQNRIARQVADQLRAAISPEEQTALDAKLTDDVTAYDLYLRAREGEEGLRRTASEVDEQASLLEQAIARDPTFVPALCLLARVHLLAYFFNFDHSAARLERSKEALEAAARAAPDAGEVHLTRAIFFYWGKRDYASALSELAAARRTLPNDADVLFFTGVIERRQGRWEESIEHLKAAAALDPRKANIFFELANNYRSVQRFAEAARTFERVLAWKSDDFVFARARAMMDVLARADLRRLEAVVESEAAKSASPENRESARLELALFQRDYAAADAALAAYPLPDFRAGGYVIPREWYEGVIAQGLGDSARAEAAFAKAREAATRMAEAHPDEGRAIMALAEIEARLGRAEAAHGAGESAVRISSVAGDAVTGPEMLVRLAGVYARLGENTRALDLLEEAAQVPRGPTYGALELDEMWDPLRQEPRFQKLLDSLAPDATTTR